MFLSGIADEAAPDLKTQIQAHRELKFDHIELRNIDDCCVTDLDEAAFDRAAEQLAAANLTVSCFASQLANWSRPINTDFEIDLAELRRAIPRMKRLGTRFIRCMSYPNSDPPLPESKWRGLVIERMKRLAGVAESGDVILVHENCHGWAGQGARQANELLAEVKSPHLKLVFDTGNPICEDQNSWDLYRELRDHIVYVHIKDYRRLPEADRSKTSDAEASEPEASEPEASEPEEGVAATFPGEGECFVKEIVNDLLQTGYDGGFSIEPHITSVIHLALKASDPETAYRTYIEYGRKVRQLFSS